MAIPKIFLEKKDDFIVHRVEVKCEPGNIIVSISDGNRLERHSGVKGEGLDLGRYDQVNIEELPEDTQRG